MIAELEPSLFPDEGDKHQGLKNRYVVEALAILVPDATDQFFNLREGGVVLAEELLGGRLNVEGLGST